MSAEKKRSALTGVIDTLTDAASTGVYAQLYKPLITRICAEEAPKYKTDRERIKVVKSRLHQLYGAYAGQASPKKRELMLDTNRVSLLSLHASTRERLPYMTAFYAFIQTALLSLEPPVASPAAPLLIPPAAEIKTVLDVGCGYNPFTIPWMPWRDCLTAYYAYDIDTETTSLINRFLTGLGLPATAKEADLVVETPTESADLALLCKLLPVLDAQKKGRGYALLEALNVRLAVVTFPLKSLSGREKGMYRHYKGLFETYLKQPGCSYRVVDQAEIGGELVYVLARVQRTS